MLSLHLIDDDRKTIMSNLNLIDSLRKATNYTDNEKLQRKIFALIDEIYVEIGRIVDIGTIKD